MKVAIETDGLVLYARLPHSHHAALKQIAQLVLILHHLFAHHPYLLVVKAALAIHLPLVALISCCNHAIDDIAFVVLDMSHTYFHEVGHSIVGGVGISAEKQVFLCSAVDDSRKCGEVVNRGVGKDVGVVVYVFEYITHHLVGLDKLSIAVIESQTHNRHIKYMFVYLRCFVVDFVLAGLFGDIVNGSDLFNHITIIIQFRKDIGI